MLAARWAPRAAAHTARLGALLAALASSRAAHARELRLTATTECPAAAKVAHALRRLGRAVDEGDPSAALVEIIDRGPSYEVRIGELQRTVADQRRNCEDRARSAAVVIALLLDLPPREPAPVEPTVRSLPPQAWPDPPKTAVPPPRRRSLALDLEVAGAVQLAPDSRGPPLSEGADLRIAFGAGYLGAVIGVSGMSPATLDLGEGTLATVTRLSIDLGLRLAWRRRSVELDLDAGLFAAFLFIAGTSFAHNAKATRLDPGGRVSGAVRVWLTRRIALSLSAALEVSFRPENLVVNPDGTVGTTPRMWLGPSLGLVGRLWKRD
jgi:hypothetical protein